MRIPPPPWYRAGSWAHAAWSQERCIRILDRLVKPGETRPAAGADAGGPTRGEREGVDEAALERVFSLACTPQGGRERAHGSNGQVGSASWHLLTQRRRDRS